MKVSIRKSGNSAALRIPPTVLKEMNLTIGEDMNMVVEKDRITFEKTGSARAGWFDNVSVIAAEKESEIMESEFGAIMDENIDDIEGVTEW